VSLTWRDIPGFFDFATVYDEAVDRAPRDSILVEVGCLFGRSTLYLAERIKQANKGLILYAVDRWDMSAWPDGCGRMIFQAGGESSNYMNTYGGFFEAFRYALEGSGLKDYVTVVRRDSVDAATEMLNAVYGGRVSFVFIDANHTYGSVRADIEAWEKVLAPGGYLAGHDYEQGWPGVTKAVDEHFGPTGFDVVGHSWVAKH
jgi:cephalosporin hydroxylase